MNKLTAVCVGMMLVVCLPVVAQTQTSGATELPTESTVKMSPNPFSEHINLRLPDSDQHYKVQVFNNFGQLIYSEKMRGGANSIVTQNWAPGHYIIKVNDLVAQKMILLD